MPSPIRLAASPRVYSSGSQPSVASSRANAGLSALDALGCVVELRVPIDLVDQSADRRGVDEESERVVLVPVMLIAHGTASLAGAVRAGFCRGSGTAHDMRPC